MTRLLTCALCGHAFDTATEPACAACPLAGGCSLVCCPRCGHVGVDPDRSVLARTFLRWRGRRNRRRAPRVGGPSVADLLPEERGVVAGFSPALAEDIVDRLSAYGLTPGCDVAIIQRRPVIVVAVDRTELALEEDIARHSAVHLVG